MKLVYMSPLRVVSVVLNKQNTMIDQSAVLVGQEGRKNTNGWSMILFNSDCPDGRICFVTAPVLKALGVLTENEK